MNSVHIAMVSRNKGHNNNINPSCENKAHKRSVHELLGGQHLSDYGEEEKGNITQPLYILILNKQVNS